MLNSCDDIESLFPPEPEKPREEDCCGSGCSPCVFDIYSKQLSEWESACCKLRENQGKSDAYNTDADTLLSSLQYSPFQLISVTQHAENANIYRFQAVHIIDGKVMKIARNLGFSIGQHLVMRNNKTGTDQGVLTRAYTPISDSKTALQGCFDVLIKLYSNGKMSNFIRNLNLDDIVYWRGPFGDFKYIPNKYKFVFMLCAGTGVTPLYPIARRIVEDETEETFVRLIFSCKRCSEMLLREEIRELAGYWNFTARIFITQDVASAGGYREQFTLGRVTSSVLVEEFSGKPLENVLVLICGTKAFNKDMLNYMQQIGVPSMNIIVF
ncbi:NADH-cytochrome b5 reductase-like [Anabrus simplex]|uniref:NADH-cytochrome b5 reductase-like n=1 Tax=Anabrus simplex TaxID=316456 RepID=UPI0035A39D0A